MRPNTTVPVDATKDKAELDTFIPMTANLSITITIKTERQPKAPIKYRAIRRSDGVIVERPRYQPATLPLQQSEPKTVASKLPATLPAVGRHEALMKRINKDLAAVGSSWEAMSQACAKARAADCGRDGYNQGHDATRKTCKRTSVPVISNSPMLERYLATDGPWSVYEPYKR